MIQLKQAADALGAQVEDALVANRRVVIEIIEGRKAEVLDSAYYNNATDEAQQRVTRTIDQILARVGNERQIALIREQGNSFEEKTYPELLDQLASSARPTDGTDGTDGVEPTLIRQTVSVKRITVPGAHGVLENPEDVDRYLDALRDALLNTLNDGKRIAL
jgi:hypothetical protein